MFRIARVCLSTKKWRRRPSFSPPLNPFPIPLTLNGFPISTYQYLLGVLFSTLFEEVMAKVVTTSWESCTMLEAAFSPLLCLTFISYVRSFSLFVTLPLYRRLGCTIQRSQQLALRHWQIVRRHKQEPLIYVWSWTSIYNFCRYSDVHATQPRTSLSVLIHHAIQFDLMSIAMDHSDSSSRVAFTPSTPRSPSSQPRQSNDNSSDSGAAPTVATVVA